MGALTDMIRRIAREEIAAYDRAGAGTRNVDRSSIRDAVQNAHGYIAGMDRAKTTADARSAAELAAARVTIINPSKDDHAATIRRSRQLVFDGNRNVPTNEKVNRPRPGRDADDPSTKLAVEHAGKTTDRVIEVVLNLNVSRSVVVNVNAHGSPSVSGSAALTADAVDRTVGDAAGTSTTPSGVSADHREAS